MNRTTTLLAGMGVAVVLLLSALAIAGASANAAPSAHAAPAWGWGNNTTAGPNYTVTFQEVGLSTGTNWSVVVCITWWCADDSGAYFNTSNTSSMTFAVPNGTYNYHVFPVNGNWSVPSRGSFTVNGTAPAPITVNFGPPQFYTVTFSETGLPAGTVWSIFVVPSGSFGGCGNWNWGCGCGGNPSFAPAATPQHHHGGGWGNFFNSSNTSTITFRLTNGTYNYTILDVPGYSLLGVSNGSLNISGSSPATIDLTFSALPTYSVSFVETGLPNGTNWSVFVFGSGQFGSPTARGFGHGFWHHVHFEGSSSNTTITLALTNGSYRYHLGWVPGYYSNESFGRFNVSGGSPAPIAITFSPIPEYNVSFNESGLPGGTDWGITIVGVGGHYGASPAMHIVLAHAARGTVSFSLPAGHYHVKVLKLNGFKSAHNFLGSHFTVGGHALTFTVGFSPSHHGSTHGAGAGGDGALPMSLRSAEPGF